jgi:hypothetical protein
MRRKEFAFNFRDPSFLSYAAAKWGKRIPSLSIKQQFCPVDANKQHQKVRIKIRP